MEGVSISTPIHTPGSPRRSRRAFPRSLKASLRRSRAIGPRRGRPKKLPRSGDGRAASQALGAQAGPDLFSRPRARADPQATEAPGLHHEEITSQIGFARTLLLLKDYTSKEARAALDEGRSRSSITRRCSASRSSTRSPSSPTRCTASGLQALVAVRTRQRELAARCLWARREGRREGRDRRGRTCGGLEPPLFRPRPWESPHLISRAVTLFDPAENGHTTRYGGEILELGARRPAQRSGRSAAPTPPPRCNRRAPSAMRRR